MFNFIRRWWRHRTTQQMNKDVCTIIRRDQAAYTDAHLQKIAGLTRSYLEGFGSASGSRTRELDARLRTRHQEARRRNDQAELSAASLAIIYRRATAVGEAATPARDAVDEFLECWPDAE